MRQPSRPTPLTKEQVIDRLLCCVGGQIVACNMVDGLENDLIDPAWTANVLAWMGELSTFDDYAQPEQLVQALDDLRTRRYSVASSLPAVPPDIRLGSVDAPSPFDVEVTCVVAAWVLGNMMSEGDQGRLAGEGLVLPTRSAEISNADVDKWRGKPASLRKVRLAPAPPLGDTHSVVWFTRRDALPMGVQGEGTTALAQRIRDLLGLVHHQQGTLLAAMHFSPRTLSACASARPTFADAGSHRRFKTWPDSVSARNQRSWGSTVDLHALAAARPSVDGCPERVTKSIESNMLTGEATFEIELLGALPAPSDETTDPVFAHRLLNGRTVAQLGAALKALTNG